MIDGALHQALRTRTAGAHRRLEAALGLMDGPPRRDRFVRALAAFHAFYAAWEPVASPTLAAQGWALAPRRLLIGRDLLALGETLPLPASAEPTSSVGAADPVAVWGSVYVTEGSALGGRLIARALRGATWAPPGGLVSFDPYGRDTGRRWAECRGRLDALPAEAAEVVAAAAAATFDELLRLAAPAPRKAAA